MAKTYYEKSISYRPNNIHTLVLLGETYFTSFPSLKTEDRQKSIDKITALADQALSIDPNYIHAQTLLYKAFLMQSKWAEANAVGKKIVSLLPSDITLTPAQKAEYNKYYSGTITDVKITSVKITQSRASTSTTVDYTTTSKANPFTKTKK